jgi:predicted  nucleic acid-binding Zn-ribbon protein
MDRAEAEAKLAEVAARREQAREVLGENARRLAALEEQRVELEGQTALAERAITDYEQYLERLQDELAAIKVGEARSALEAAVAARDRAARDAADAARNLRAAYEGLQAERQSVEAARRSLVALDPSSQTAVLPEEPEYADAWHDLAPRVKEELDIQLESELVDAAAKSGNVYEIDRLPEHLQILARERRRELIRNRMPQEQ